MLYMCERSFDDLLELISLGHDNHPFSIAYECTLSIEIRYDVFCAVNSSKASLISLS